ncbi:MAG: hypothetical protein RIC35_09170 [Marinoscillum sp.]
MNRLLIKILFAAVLVFSSVIIVMAQAAAPPPPPSAPPGPGVPIDGGLTILAAAGIGYGAARYRKSRKGKNEA